jgi:hypothetical protein
MGNFAVLELNELIELLWAKFRPACAASINDESVKPNAYE